MASLIVHEREGRSLLMRLLQTAVKPFRPALVSPSKLPPEPERLTAPKKTRKQCQVIERQFHGIWVYDLIKISKGQTRCPSIGKCRRRILYFPGGGWQMPPSGEHWAFCTEIVRRMDNTKVTIVSCPLAPKHPASVAFPHIERVYKHLLTESTKAGEDVIVAGDSSGGNIALSLVAWALKSQENELFRPPVAVLAISPTTDLRHELPGIEDVDKLDPLQTLASIKSTAKFWCPGLARLGPDYQGNSELENRIGCNEWTFEDPRVSPIQADLSPFVRHNVSVHGVTASYDVLGPEAVVFRDKCRENRVGGDWLSWKGQIHCFPLAFRYGLSEGKEGMNWIISILEKH